MLRRLRRLLVLLLVLVLVVAAVVVVFGNRSALGHARTRIDARWASLRAPLDARYHSLSLLGAALGQDVGRGAALPSRLNRALSRWSRASQARDAATGVEVANELEGLAGLVRVTATSTDRLKADARLGRAVTAFNGTVPPAATVNAYNAAVRAYEHDRTSGVRRLTAALFGYDARRTFELVATT
jgi:hypothetical protein